MSARAATALAAAAVCVCAAAPGPALASGTGGSDVLVAMARPDASAAALASAAGGRPRLLSRALGVWLVRAARGADPARLARRLARRPEVAAAQPDVRLRAAATPILPCAARPDSPLGWWLATVRADRVDAPAQTGPIALLDTGVDGSLPELAGKLRSPLDALSGGVDVADRDGHGTGVAGIAAARPGALRGVSPTSPIVPIRVFDASGETTTAALVKAIDAAVAAHAAAINMSLAGPADESSASDDRVLEMAIDRAFIAGALVVAATGNEGDDSLNVPSAYPHVLSVAATDSADAVASFSNGGPSVDLAAPGVDLVTTAPAALCPTGFALASGTSFAAPAVAGAAALVKAARPDLSAPQVFALLRTSARDIGPRGFDPDAGFGVLDVTEALRAAAPPPDSPEVDDDVYWITGRYAARHPLALTPRRRSARLSGQVSAFNDPADVYRVKLRSRDRLTARLRAPTGTRYALSVWNARTRGFDITSGRERGRLVAASDRRGSSESLAVEVRRGGVFYVAVEAPRPDAATGSYALTLRRRPG